MVNLSESSTKSKIIKQKEKERQRTASRLLWMRSIRYISRAGFFAGGLGLLLIALTRFNNMNDTSPHEVLLNVSYLILSLLIGFTQFEYSFVLNHFRFLNYHWGRAIFAFALCSISYAGKGQNRTIVQGIVAMYFWFVGCFFLMLAIADRGTDKLQAIIDEDQDRREKFASDNQAILTAKKRVKKSSKKLIANIRSFAEALD